MSPWVRYTLGPLLLAQARAARRRAPALPEAAGEREGELGDAAQPLLRVLIVGDSSAAGVGVDAQDRALAGYLTRHLHARTRHRVRWALHARSGSNTQQVLALLQQAQTEPADVAVVASGVNDLIDEVPADVAMAYRAALVAQLRAVAQVRHVVFTPLPPVHQFPLLPQPLRYLAGRDARQHNRALAAWAARERGLSFVPVPVRLNRSNMAIDGFHPGEPVYRLCGELVAEHIATQVWPRLQASKDSS
ncbi:MAG: SGNH/GDSL hydrolase family protein [Betaproteobacteria bacterium]|nr:SGNH/GDSL hydrolase family protein [Betaproteobacteria bacterium]MDE2047035.1 SGNH/GDSL hydrolase family protein [Betaproteobacteria bacterium]